VFIKVVIVLLFIGVVISLSSALVFLMKDIGDLRKRTFYALAIRITLATTLLATIIYGLYTGQLSSTAPWDRQLHPEASALNTESEM
jgi:hypothetical protein